MTALLSASTAILKTRYPDGRLPKAQFQKFPLVATVQKKEDFDGENKVIALQTENPQGSSADFATALGSLAQGTYKKFTVTRVEHFGVARIKGQALKAAQKSTGSLVDLWRNETDGISATEMKMLEIYAFGNGSGVLGTATYSTTTATLTTTTDIVNFDLGMRVNAVSDSTLSPTVRTGTATISSIDRSAGTLTTSSNWSAQITGITNGDYLVRAGDAASGGTATVITGMASWLVGGSSPGSLFGLTRSTDPVRLASQLYNATGVPMEDAVIEAESLVTIQGQGTPKRLWCNPRDIAQLKKSLGGKVTYPRSEVKGTAGVSFSAIEFAGDNGNIEIMTSPFCPRNAAFLISPETFSLDSLGPAPHMLDYDGPNFLRVASDDAYEVRFGFYGNMVCSMPVASIRISNFGA